MYMQSKGRLNLLGTMNEKHSITVILIAPATTGVTVCEHQEELGLNTFLLHVFPVALKHSPTATLRDIVKHVILIVLGKHRITINASVKSPEMNVEAVILIHNTPDLAEEVLCLLSANGATHVNCNANINSVFIQHAGQNAAHPLTLLVRTTHGKVVLNSALDNLGQQITPVNLGFSHIPNHALNVARHITRSLSGADNSLLNLISDGLSLLLAENWTALTLTLAVTILVTIAVAIAFAAPPASDGNRRLFSGTIDDVLAKSPAQVSQFKEGKQQVLGFLVGQVMKASKGKANPAQVNELLRRKLGR